MADIAALAAEAISQYEAVHPGEPTAVRLHPEQARLLINEVKARYEDNYRFWHALGLGPFPEMPYHPGVSALSEALWFGTSNTPLKATLWGIPIVLDDAGATDSVRLDAPQFVAVAHESVEDQ